LKVTRKRLPVEDIPALAVALETIIFPGTAVLTLVNHPLGTMDPRECDVYETMEVSQESVKSKLVGFGAPARVKVIAIVTSSPGSTNA
jgi:hypothetical protein